MRQKMIGMGLAVLVAGPALAQELPSVRDARHQIFARYGDMAVEVVPHDSLNPAEITLLERLVSDNILPDMAYYGALAIAPDAGLANPETTVAVGNFHDEANARAAALERCEAARSGGAPCAVVAVIRPEGWEPGRDLQLSSAATAGLWGELRTMARPRVMSISPATGNWGVGASAEAANAACGAPDCRPAVAD